MKTLAVVVAMALAGAVGVRAEPVGSVRELSHDKVTGVAVREVDDYVFGGYGGAFPSPPSADGNPRRAIVVLWRDHDYRLVFSHEGSYCPWFEFSSGAGACFQFFEGNDGWAELFNQFGRMEKNSSIEVRERGPQRAWIRWTYRGVNLITGEAAYEAVEDFWAYPNGLVLRKQSFKSLLPGEHRGYAREPIELIGMCPVGKLWRDVLRIEPGSERRHALAVLDPFSQNRYDVYWTPNPAAAGDAECERRGAAWKELDDSAGVALALPLGEGTPFVAFGEASGFPHEKTRIKEHSFADTGGNGWIASSWDHWPIGWLNSQGHAVDLASLARYPNHFSPAGMDFFAMSNEETERGVYYSLCGVAEGEDLEPVRKLVRQWLEQDAERLSQGGVAQSAALGRE